MHWQDSTQHMLKWTPEQGCVYRHKAAGAECRGRAWKHQTSPCSKVPQGYMQSHIHSELFACKWLMDTRMLLYCLFKTHCNSSGYFIENQHKKDMAKPQANNIYCWWWRGMALRRLKNMPIPTELIQLLQIWTVWKHQCSNNPVVRIAFEYLWFWSILRTESWV